MRHEGPRSGELDLRHVSCSQREQPGFSTVEQLSACSLESSQKEPSSGLSGCSLAAQSHLLLVVSQVT